jgi:hypothetical protein
MLGPISLSFSEPNGLVDEDDVDASGQLLMDLEDPEREHADRDGGSD